MNVDSILKLVDAGFTRDEILKMTASETIPAVPADANTPPPTVSEAETPATEEAAPGYDLLDVLTKRIDALTRAVQANAITNSAMPPEKTETAHDVLASIIMPTYKGGSKE